jgi:uncharacterized protein (DUF1778 family)
MHEVARATKSRRVITAMRLDESERGMVDAAAGLAGVNVSDLLRSIVLPEVTARVARSAVRSGVGLQGRGW